MEGFSKVSSDDLERVNGMDGSSGSVTADSADKSTGHTCRQRLCNFLNNNKFQISVVCLVIIDCLLVIAELLIDLQILKTESHSIIPEVLHYISIGILSVFMVELMLKIFAFQLEFFHHKMEVFDAIVVIVAFALDITFASKDGLEPGVGLLVLLRLWRITRILNGIILSVKTQTDRQLKQEKALRKDCEQELANIREYCSIQEKQMEILQGLLHEHGIEFEKVEWPVKGSTKDTVTLNSPSMSSAQTLPQHDHVLNI